VVLSFKFYRITYSPPSRCSQQAQEDVDVVRGNLDTQGTPEAGGKTAVDEDVRRVLGSLPTDLTRSILDNLFPGQVNAALDIEREMCPWAISKYFGD
jgi:hypothetical protein